MEKTLRELTEELTLRDEERLHYMEDLEKQNESLKSIQEQLVEILSANTDNLTIMVDRARYQLKINKDRRNGNS